MFDVYWYRRQSWWLSAVSFICLNCVKYDLIREWEEVVVQRKQTNCWWVIIRWSCIFSIAIIINHTNSQEKASLRGEVTVAGSLRPSISDPCSASLVVDLMASPYNDRMEILDNDWRMYRSTQNRIVARNKIIGTDQTIITN